ncbi:MAG: hypothetical protein WD768_02660 [Phycisphaeraceae bacterium]
MSTVQKTARNALVVRFAVGALFVVAGVIAYYLTPETREEVASPAGYTFRVERVLVRKPYWAWGCYGVGGLVWLVALVSYRMEAAASNLSRR